MAINKSILNLGCGRKVFPDAVNLDVTPRTNPDVVHDLNQVPWPFADDSFNELRAYDILEHLDDLLSVMEEVHRVCKAGATVKITVPHYSSSNAFTDPTHRHFFSLCSFDYFTEENATSFYSRARLRINVARLQFHPSLMNKFVWRLAGRYPQAYEQRWAWIFPAWYVYFELQVLK
jgi:SAM-dependent methyltransferase